MVHLALLQKAHDALHQGARAEAEQLAVEALRRGESPEARGVLAGFPSAQRPRLVARFDLLACQGLRPSPDGRWFTCMNDGTLSLWQVTPTGPKRQWQRAMDVGDAVVVPNALVAEGAVIDDAATPSWPGCGGATHGGRGAALVVHA